MCLFCGKFLADAEHAAYVASAFEAQDLSADWMDLPSAAIVGDYTALLSGSSWAGSGITGRAAIVTFSFETSVPGYAQTTYSGYPSYISSFTALTAAQQDTARAALSQWENICGLKFIEVPAGLGDITFSNFTASLSNSPGWGGRAYYPSRGVSATSSYDFPIGGYVEIDNGTSSNTSLSLFLHEIGHAIGLKHPFDGTNTLSTALDNKTNTVMSYTGAGVNVLGYLDVQAAQYIYGTVDAAHLSNWAWDAASLRLTQIGTAGNDTILGVNVSDYIVGGDGADNLSGYGGSDTLEGNAGNDTMFGGDGNDSVLGAAGADSLLGEAGDDWLSGGSENDTLWGGEGNDTLEGGDGDDYLSAGAGANVLDGGAGADQLVGDSGDDILTGGSGGDLLYGGGGRNGASYLNALGVVVNLASSGLNTGDAAGDGYSSIQDLYGSHYNDSLTGDSASNLLRGYEGYDSIVGQAGSDTLMGEAGIDTLVGGASYDTFLFTPATLPVGGASNIDIVTDFNRGFYGTYFLNEDDRLDVSALTAGVIAGGQPINRVVRLVDAQNGAGSLLQVDVDGAGFGAAWTTIGVVSGRHEAELMKTGYYGASTSMLTTMRAAGFSGDFNGDGKADVLIRRDNGTLGVWLLNGTTLAGAGTLSAPDNSWSVVGVADFDGDGKSDILFRNSSTALAMWKMNGVGIAAGPGIGSTPDATWQVAATADFTGDGKADILWRNDSGLLALWTMNGAAILSGPAIGSSPGPAWHIAGAGDFNGDGKADILWRHDNGGCAMWLMNGPAILAGPSLAAPTTDWHVAGILDVNGDGKSDVLWRHDNGTVFVWAMDGAGVIGQGVIGGPDQSWQIAGTGDYNGDGRGDILWRNTNGALAEWQLLGNAISGGGTVNVLPGDWKTQTHNYDFV